MGPCIWTNAEERAKTAQELLELLKFKNIEVVTNASKAKYVEKLTALKKYADDFEVTNKDTKETLAVAIINIGNRLDPLAPSH